MSTSLSSSTNPAADGQCLCGAVTYQLSAEPIYNVVCHCYNCRRLACAFQMTSIIPTTGVTITDSTSALKTFSDKETDSKTPLQRSFCGHCGTHMFVRTPIADSITAVLAGTLIDYDKWKPGKEQYVDCRAPWLPETLGVAERYVRGAWGGQKIE